MCWRGGTNVQSQIPELAFNEATIQRGVGGVTVANNMGYYSNSAKIKNFNLQLAWPLHERIDTRAILRHSHECSYDIVALIL